MKVRAMTAPEPVWIRFISDTGEAFVRLRQNVCLKADDEDDFDRRYYEWDEVEIILVDRENLLGYVQTNFDELFAYGLAEEAKPKPKTPKELRDEQIKELQNENTELKESVVETNEFLIDLYETILGGE